jgi:pimeloyl-ACP methyl ester carboxylesterase
VSLAFVVLPARGAIPAIDPVVFVAGGPGQTLTEIAHTFDFSALRLERDIILLDQRGTSVSPRLDCPATTGDAQSLLAPIFDPAAMAACRDALQSTADLRRYTTIETVADLEAFRHALGYPRVNLIGASYGTRVILHYLRAHPGSVRSAVMTSAVPFAFRNPLFHAQSAQSGLDTLLAWCESQSCGARYPAVRSHLSQLLTRLEAQPVTTQVVSPFTGQTVTVQLTRATVAEALRVMMYSRATSAMIPQVLHEAATGHYENLARHALTSLGSLRNGLRVGLLMSVVCSEDAPRIAESEIDGVTSGTFFGDARVRQQLAACATWPRADIPPEYGNEVVSSVPSLVISGRFDPVTPPKWGQPGDRLHQPAYGGLRRFRQYGDARCIMRCIPFSASSASATLMSSGVWRRHRLRTRRKGTRRRPGRR